MARATRHPAARLVWAAVLTLLIAATARGQETGDRPDEEGSFTARVRYVLEEVFTGTRLQLHVNGAYRGAAARSEQRTTFRAYGEQGRLRTREDFPGGGHVDVGGSLRVWRGLLAGASFTQSRGSGRAVVTGTVPHPIETGRDRTAPTQEVSLVHRERATHWFAGWRFPLRESLALELSAGATYYSLRRGVVAGLTPAETGAGPPFDEVALHVAAGEHTRNGVGFNAGLDVVWMFLPPTRIPQLGVGVFARTSGVGVLLPTGAGPPRRVSAGGLQAGIGLRARF